MKDLSKNDYDWSCDLNVHRPFHLVTECRALLIFDGSLLSSPDQILVSTFLIWVCPSRWSLWAQIGDIKAGDLPTPTPGLWCRTPHWCKAGASCSFLSFLSNSWRLRSKFVVCTNVSMTRPIFSLAPIGVWKLATSLNEKPWGTLRKGGVCYNYKRTEIAYLIPNFNWQLLRLLVIGTPGPAWTSYLLNVTLTEVLSTIELWVICILRKPTRHTIEDIGDRSWWTSWSV